ncbi:FADH(2)-oxidizing methylenetetrahydrofolate--tRNA-(uracil(54)-C(5))-methyltransferase TrmFO [Mesoplasma syrphidae]|uniref:Methylenetetrahydrofolate--tRNA-(uracil-5-)-methyltransferase TrmFO n=1 Tax=Mesoplasma syrphidae TaxID=225999 RepID=A0A2K9BJ96_9MOLU|nr:methylenetetrahydrofolate--tRNA-(uracil(54)-C(5))-methyltransferase (FADH(2)-oxidizing) TrmFO [Mesoplasma syrphidae]AUF83421.1 FADH(2)-oxidizing methylenetetrahydrofolate--tRNA-(uracil(54)-C(5))-methyltransferase TrmFO [Mesoplasma syrphidae]
MGKVVKIIGAGLAGTEAAYQLAKHGVKVKLYESKFINPNPVQKTDQLAELVCSNTLRSRSKTNAVGILKTELEAFDSLVIRAAYANQIPGDDALAVDRLEFSQYITKMINNEPNIEIISEDVLAIDDENEITIIASGPLTTDNLKAEIQRLIGNQKLYFMDASAPIIEKASIDFSQVYLNSRHKTGDGEYICIPLTEHQFNEFHNALVSAEVVKTKEFEKEIFFRGCQPIEQMAKQGKRVLLNGPMSPNNLPMPNGEIPFAVVQLRQDNAIDTLYNFVGFQTNLKWPEQKRILKTLPGMNNLEIVRYGVMHKNYYINSPKILNHKLQVMRKKNVFFAGQITGVEGYVESTALGVVAALGVLSILNNKKLPKMPNTTVIGALTNYVTNEKLKKFNPMKANMGILDRSASDQSELFSYNQSVIDLNAYLEEIKDIIKPVE